MKYFIIIAIFLVWLGCLVEFAALASVALRVQNAGSIGVTIVMMGWLGLTGLCCIKLTRRAPVPVRVVA